MNVRDRLFALQDPVTGEVSFTRDGSFTMSHMTAPPDPEKEWETEPQDIWILSDGNGRFVLDRNQERIQLEPYAETEAPGTTAYDIGIFDFDNYNGMVSVSENRLMPVEKNGEMLFGTGKLLQGCLEMSNADLAEQMAKVIESQRSFQYMLRMVTTSDEIENTVNNLR